MTQITLFGATGLVGKRLVAKAIEREYQVKVLVRNVEKLGKLSDKVDVIQGDYFNPDDITSALDGSASVISTIGPPLKGKKNVDTEAYIKSLKHLTKTMEANGQKRIITVAGAGIIYPGEKLPVPRKIMRTMLKLMAKPVVTIKDQEVAILFDTNLDFTIVRPPMIVEKNRGSLQAHETKSQGMKVHVGQLCDFMLENLESGEWIGKAPVVGSK